MEDRKKKYSRAQLAALAAQQAQEIERLHAQLAAAEEKLRDRRIVTARAGTMADAAMEMNGVLKAADEAAAQYLENIRLFTQQQHDNCAQIERQTREKAEAMLRETQERCRARELEADAYWEKLSEKLERFCTEHRELRDLLGELEESKGELRRGAADVGSPDRND
ncbi:MAG: hypothetical protein IJT44_11610 [Clostridia bacterium]|nr:hypothetical protein [Clostridia bacterium]